MTQSERSRGNPRLAQIVPGFTQPFFQAGLAGYSDGAMRLVARRHGCPYCVTEALHAATLVRGGKGLAKTDPDCWEEPIETDSAALDCGGGELVDNCAAGLDDHPLAAQIIGCDPDVMAAAARRLGEMRFEVIDVNLACPAKKARRQLLQGGNLLAHSERAIEILRAVRAAVPASQPMTVKLRRAYDDGPEYERHFERIFNAAFELGCAWVTVHARTVVQRYDGSADWSFLRALTRRYPDRLVFGSGDVATAFDVLRMLDECGVAAVAIARGCIGNPWIFRQTAQLLTGRAPTAPTIEEMGAALRLHCELCVRLHGPEVGGRLMRKFGIKFAALDGARVEQLRAAFIRASSLADWWDVLAEYFPTATAAVAPIEASDAIPSRRSGS
ncbi:MAG: tRNA dihydrouridine synthase [Planctomycetota bacterium]